MKPWMLAAALLPMLASCATTSTTPTVAGTLSAPDAVMRAADAAPDGVHGRFAMTVRAVGTKHGMTFLNSEPDYRDQRNLSIALAPKTVETLEKRFNAPLKQALLNQQIVVDGTARRTRIDFIDDDGKRTDKYYYQTHIALRVAEQLQRVDLPEQATAAR